VQITAVPTITAPTSTATTTAALATTATTAAASAFATVRDAAAEARATLESMPHHSINTVQVYTMLCMQRTLRPSCNGLHSQCVLKASYQCWTLVESEKSTTTAA
jgi:hypothetical protein